METNYLVKEKLESKTNEYFQGNELYFKRTGNKSVVKKTSNDE